MADEKQGGGNSFVFNTHDVNGPVGNAQTINGGVNQINNYGDQPLTPDKVLDLVVEKLPPELPPEEKKELIAKVIEPMRQLVQLPAEEQKSPTVVDRVKGFCTLMAPHQKYIAAGLLSASVSGLQLMATSYPALGVLLAGIGVVKSMFDADNKVPAAAAQTTKPPAPVSPPKA